MSSGGGVDEMLRKDPRRANAGGEGEARANGDDLGEGQLHPTLSIHLASFPVVTRRCAALWSTHPTITEALFRVSSIPREQPHVLLETLRAVSTATMFPRWYPVKPE